MSFRKSVWAWVAFGVFAVMAVALAFEAEPLSAQLQAQPNPLLALLVYLASNPAYLLVVGGAIAYKMGNAGGANKIVSISKGFVAGVFISFAADIVSLPHCLPQSATTPVPAMAQLCSDYILAQPIIAAGVPQNVAWFGYYVVLPVLLVFFAIKLLGEDGFAKNIQNRMVK